MPLPAALGPTTDAKAPAGAAVSPAFALLLLAAATAATPLYLNVLGHVTLRSTDLLVFLAAIAEGISTLRRGRLALVSTPLDAPWLVFFAAIAASLSVADDRLQCLRALRPLVLLVLAFHVASAHLTDLGKVRRLLLAPFVGLGLQAAFGIAELFLGGAGMQRMLEGPVGRYLYEADVVRANVADMYFNWTMGPDDPFQAIGLSTHPSGTSINGTTFSVLMALVAVTVLLLPSATRRRAFLAVGASSVAVLLMLLTFKRSGWVAVLAALPFAWLAGGRRILQRAAVVLAVVIVAHSLLLWLQPAAAMSLWSRAHSVGGEVVHAGTGDPNSRLHLWQRAFQLFLRHPLTGVGIGQWPHYGPWTPTRRGLIQWGNPESYVVGIAAETGVFGLLGFLALFAVPILLGLRLAWRRGPEALWAGLAVAALVVLSVGVSVDNSFTDDKVWPLFAVYAASALALHRLAGAGPKRSPEGAS